MTNKEFKQKDGEGTIEDVTNRFHAFMNDIDIDSDESDDLFTMFVTGKWNEYELRSKKRTIKHKLEKIEEDFK